MTLSYAHTQTDILIMGQAGTAVAPPCLPHAPWQPALTKQNFHSHAHSHPHIYAQTDRQTNCSSSSAACTLIACSHNSLCHAQAHIKETDKSRGREAGNILCSYICMRPGSLQHLMSCTCLQTHTCIITAPACLSSHCLLWMCCMSPDSLQL